MNHKDATTFYKAYKTILELLTDRGLRIIDEGVVHPISFREFQSSPPTVFQVEKDNGLVDRDGEQSLNDPIRKYRGNNLQFVVFLYGEFRVASKENFTDQLFTEIYAKYGQSLLETREERFVKNKHKDLMKKLGKILVIYSSPAKNNPQEYTEYLKDDFDQVEFHEAHHTVFNPTKHAYQPKFTLLNNKEARRVRDLYGGTNLQIITKNDRINRWYGGVLGDIYLIRRKNGQVNYRYVIN